MMNTLPPAATHLILVRHGQSLQNHDNTWPDPNSGLTELGWRQARAVAEWLAHEYRPDAVLASTLTRAQQTGEVIAERFGMPLHSHQGLEEADMPYWDEIPFSQGDPLASWDDDWRPDPTTAPRYTAFRKLIYASLARLLSEYSGKTVIAVTHGGTIGTILRSVFGGHRVGVLTENTGVTHLIWDGRHWRLAYHNSTVHLAGLQPAPEPDQSESITPAPWANGRQVETITQHFRAVAQATAGLPALPDERELHELLRLAAPSPTDHVLDAATGAGTLALAFAPRVASVLGVDLSAAMLELAERTRSAQGATNVHFRLGDVGTLTLPEQEFDLIICHDLLRYIINLQALFERFSRLLCPGGRLLLDEVVGSEDPVRRATQNAIEIRRDPAVTEVPGAAEIEQALTAAGFRVSRSERYTRQIRLDDWLKRAAADEGTRSAVQSMIEAGLEADSAGLAARHTRDGQITFTQTRVRLLAVKTSAAN